MIKYLVLPFDTDWDTPKMIPTIFLSYVVLKQTSDGNFLVVKDRISGLPIDTVISLAEANSLFKLATQTNEGESNESMEIG